MKVLVTTAILCLCASAAFAQSYLTRDGSERLTLGDSFVEFGQGEWLVLRDSSGRRTGTIEEGYGNRLILRDSEGHRTGSIEPGYGGRLILRDLEGRRKGTLEWKGQK